MTRSARRMQALRLRGAGGSGDLSLDEVPIPHLAPGEALVRVHAAAITRDELDWPVDRLPAIPSSEVSGVVVEVAPDVTDVAVGDAVFALTRFDRDGAAAEYAAVPTAVLSAKPSTLSHVESAAVAMPGLTAWQGLFVHGRLEAGQRVLVHGAAGGVGHVATQLARDRGAHVIGTVAGDAPHGAAAQGAHELIDACRFDETLEPVDLVFDTAGGELLRRSAAVVRGGGRVVSVAEEPREQSRADVTVSYFVVEPNRDQLAELARLADVGALRVAVDSVFLLTDARAAFERAHARGKHGKVVLEVKRG